MVYAANHICSRTPRILNISVRSAPLKLRSVIIRAACCHKFVFFRQHLKKSAILFSVIGMKTFNTVKSVLFKIYDQLFSRLIKSFCSTRYLRLDRKSVV